MSEKKLEYTIIDKDGKVVQSDVFEDYEKLADHMLGLADNWYNGVYSAEDQLQITSLDEMGNVLYRDTASFGDSMKDETISNEFDITPRELPEPEDIEIGFDRKKPKGFGK
jgi:hypothetical protein